MYLRPNKIGFQKEQFWLNHSLLSIDIQSNLLLQMGGMKILGSIAFFNLITDDYTSSFSVFDNCSCYTTVYCTGYKRWCTYIVAWGIAYYLCEVTGNFAVTVYLQFVD